MKDKERGSSETCERKAGRLGDYKLNRSALAAAQVKSSRRPIANKAAAHRKTELH
jgi:hypothetical protein